MSEPTYSEEIEEPTADQTVFRPYPYCLWCRYLAAHYDFCAVVPFGWTNGLIERCPEFDSEYGDAETLAVFDDIIPF
ncbi:hypothetical protein [Acaryochloris marina]|uniref:Uncharacterized protein n=1 Tax=Acaryochloris marina (strain MBIC 11017) TaxID=329726 RepID=A8ZPW7_ACAM1|nr:hypothetical protein [Acaryochloris marina]ABW33011.1 hypothetical protein AM1_F0174 [Acaryochloris marina MBIC11017]BDM83202.1 hypothetical protein AM10699_60630 [Acaryochloris marina MBIC10699]